MKTVPDTFSSLFSGLRSGQSILDLAEQLADQTDRTARLIHGWFPWLTGVAKNPGVGGQSCHTPTEWLQRRVDLRALKSQLVEVVGLAKTCVARGQERFKRLLSGLLAMKQAVFEQWGIGSRSCSAARRSAATFASHACISAVRAGSGGIEQLPLQHDGGRKRGDDMASPVELLACPDENIGCDAESPQEAVGLLCQAISWFDCLRHDHH